MTKIEVGEKIKKFRTAAGMTQEELAGKLGLKSRAAINKIEKGLCGLSLQQAEIASKVFGVDPAVFITGEESTVKEIQAGQIRNVPVYESASAGFGADANDYIIGYEPCLIESELEAQRTIFVKVVGDSMQPLIYEGDLLRVFKTDYIESGKVGVFLIDGETALVKRFVDRDGKIKLESENRYYKDVTFTAREFSARVRVLGVVKGISRKL